MKTEQQIFLEDVSAILTNAGIKHCLLFGTLLGAFRDNSFIPWDNEDIDAGVFEPFWKNDNLWGAFLLELQRKGYKIKDMSWNYVCIDKIEEETKYLHIDLYLLLREQSKYKVIVTGMEVSFPLEHFDSLDTIMFLGKEYRTPHNVEGFLCTTYGHSWKTPSKETTYCSSTPLNNHEKITYTYIVSIYDDFAK